MALFPNTSGAQTFLGSFDGHDLYFDPQGGVPTVIARFGPRGMDFKSGLEFAKFDRHLAVAATLATLDGLLKARTTSEPASSAAIEAELDRIEREFVAFCRGLRAGRE